MENTKNNLAALREAMRRQAEAVATQVLEAPDLEAALALAVSLAQEEAAASPGEKPVIYARPAPEIPADAPAARFAASFELAARGLGWEVLDAAHASPLPQITAAVSFADLGIAETGGCLFNSGSEDFHLAVMLAARHIVILPVQNIAPGLAEAGATASAYLAERAGQAAMSAMITGCSRTSDIERVLTLGAHGPISMHLILVERV